MRAHAGLCQAVCALPAKAFPLAKQVSATATNTPTVSQLMGSNAPLPPRVNLCMENTGPGELLFLHLISAFFSPCDPDPLILKFRYLRYYYGNSV